MRIQLLNAASSEWRAFLERTTHDFYHLPEYATLCARGEGGEPLAVLVAEDERELLLPLLKRPLQGQDGRLAVDLTSPYGYPGPLVSGEGAAHPDFLQAALAGAANALREAGAISLFVRLHPLLNAGWDRLATLGRLVTHGPTVSIDLSQPAEQHWSETQSGHRSEINKSLRSGHRMFMDEDWKHFDSFVRIYEETMRRVAASGSYFFSRDYYRDLRSALGGRLHLAVVTIGEEVGAAALISECQGIVQYHLSGTDSRFVRERPTKLLLHGVRSWAQERGNSRFHLGGGLGAAEDSLFRFKAGFSKGRAQFQTLRVVLAPDAYRAQVRQRDASWDADDTAGFFPLYRRPLQPAVH